MTTADRRYGGRTVVARKAERRQRFLEAATQIFAERGYATCSLAEVCAAAGLSKRQFYEEFDTREDVLAAAYDRIHDEAAVAVMTAVASTAGASVAAAGASVAAAGASVAAAGASVAATGAVVAAGAVVGVAEEQAASTRASDAASVTKRVF